jgi:hypothetical protein
MPRKKSGVVVHSCCGSHEWEDHGPGWPGGKPRDPIWKVNKEERTGGLAQVVEWFPSKHKILSSSPSTTKQEIYEIYHNMLLLKAFQCLLIALGVKSKVFNVTWKVLYKLMVYHFLLLHMMCQKCFPKGIPRWWLEGGSRKRASYSEILERCWRHTFQA